MRDSLVGRQTGKQTGHWRSAGDRGSSAGSPEAENASQSVTGEQCSDGKERDGHCGRIKQQVQSPASRSESSELSRPAGSSMKLAGVSREQVGRGSVDGGVQGEGVGIALP